MVASIVQWRHNQENISLLSKQKNTARLQTATGQKAQKLTDNTANVGSLLRNESNALRDTHLTQVIETEKNRLSYSKVLLEEVYQVMMQFSKETINAADPIQKDSANYIIITNDTIETLSNILKKTWNGESLYSGSKLPTTATEIDQSTTVKGDVSATEQCFADLFAALNIAKNVGSPPLRNDLEQIMGLLDSGTNGFISGPQARVNVALQRLEDVGERIEKRKMFTENSTEEANGVNLEESVFQAKEIASLLELLQGLEAMDIRRGSAFDTLLTQLA